MCALQSLVCVSVVAWSENSFRLCMFDGFRFVLECDERYFGTVLLFYTDPPISDSLSDRPRH